MSDSKLTADNDVLNKMPNSTMSKHEKVTLMTLPAEIRNEIFEYAYIKRESTGEKRAIRLLSLKTGRTAFTTGLRICKQLRLDLKPVIYGVNVFQLEQINLEYRSVRRGAESYLHSETDQHMLELYAWHEISIDRYGYSYDEAGEVTSYGMALPPNSIRALMRNTKIILSVPHPDKSAHYTSSLRFLPAYQRDAGRWLYVLRKLRSYGFEALEAVELHLHMPECETAKDDFQLFLCWIDEEIAKTDMLGAKTTKVVHIDPDNFV